MNPASKPTRLYVWRRKTEHPERFGEQCRIVERIDHNRVRVRFRDGETVVCHRGAIRRVIRR